MSEQHTVEKEVALESIITTAVQIPGVKAIFSVIHHPDGKAAVFKTAAFLRLIDGGMETLALLAVHGRGHADMLAEYPVELGEAVETAGLCQLGDGDLGVDEQCLHIPDPCHLNIVRDRETGNLFEFMGKVAGTDAEMAGKRLQR